MPLDQVDQMSEAGPFGQNVLLPAQAADSCHIHQSCHPCTWNTLGVITAAYQLTPSLGLRL